MVNQGKRKAKVDPCKNNIAGDNASKKGHGDRKHIKGNTSKQAVHSGKMESPVDMVKSFEFLTAESTIAQVPGDQRPLLAAKSSSVCNLAVRGVGRMSSFFDLSGASSCSAGFSDGSSVAGKAGSVMLQIPSSSISVPLSASAMAMTVQSNSSAAFFHTLTPRVSGVGADLPQGSRCGPCVLADRFSGLGVSADRGDSHPDVTAVLHASTVEEGGSIGPPRVAGCTTTADTLISRMDEEDVMSKWLRALDFQAVGACRADERLRPLLRWNVSCFGADGRLLARLGLHFKAKELSALARCLSIPLVSVRVGKIMRHGLILRPTSTR